MTDNLLDNGSFNVPATLRWPAATGISGLQIPLWELEAWSKPGDPKLPGQDQDWLQPEILPVQYRVQFPEDELRYDQADDWVLKVFKGGAPTMAQFGQTVELPAGEYRFTLPVFPDQWHNVAGRLVRPSPQTSADYYLASEVRFWVDGAFDSDWLDARTWPMGQYTPRNMGFTHRGGALRVHFAARGRWGFQQNGWFVDGVTLRRIDAPPDDEEPPAVVDIEPELERIEAATAGFSANYTAYQAVVAEQIALIRQKVSRG